VRRTLTSLVARLRALVRRSRLDDELKDEIDLHIELRRQSLVESGMDPRDAAYDARRPRPDCCWGFQPRSAEPAC
jgi:hypothetical protein